MNPRRWPSEVVARVKGAVAAGIPHKVIHAHTGISLATIAQWANGTNRSHVPTEPMPQELLGNWLICK